ncbi:uncharacterized protein LOC108594885, partial [Drosophila busckii]|uniref:uncharacterized protein LOC108594885 n=1 Tax=Drosophila busckii TaxID=30019 RepID=UPI00083EDB3E
MFTGRTKKTSLVASNTQHKFKAQLRANKQSLCNRSFDTAASLSNKTRSQLKQTKLSRCQKDNKLRYAGFVEEPNDIKPKYEFMLNMNKNSNGCAQKSATKITEAAVVKLNAEQPAPTNVMDKPGRSLVSLIGRVDFCMAMQQAQPNLNALWNVYGKILRIIVGNRGEHTLLLRNDNNGPILQSIFYDFEGEIKNLSNGCYVHIVGRFINDNRLKTFSVSQVSIDVWQQNFIRIENITKYILM